MDQAILLAAYGAGGTQGAHTLGLFERKVRHAFPKMCIRWAFTSALSRSRLTAARKKTDSVKKALCRLGFEKYAQITVQSLHLVHGEEYEDLLAEIAEAQKNGAPPLIRAGLPLLHQEEDFALAARALAEHLPPDRRPEEAVVWVGHGTLHDRGEAYTRLTKAVQRLDPRIFIGALLGAPDNQAILAQLQERQIHRIWLLPLLSVVGKHAAEDIGGDSPDAWNGFFRQNNLECSTVLRGTIEYEGFASIWLNHLKAAYATPPPLPGRVCAQADGSIR